MFRIGVAVTFNFVWGFLASAIFANVFNMGVKEAALIFLPMMMNGSIALIRDDKQ